MKRPSNIELLSRIFTMSTVYKIKMIKKMSRIYHNYF